MSTDPGPPGGPFILTLSCPDRPRIVNEVTGFLVKHSGNIRESQQFGDRQSRRFFMRIDFEVAEQTTAEALRADFVATATEFGMDYELWAAAAPYRIRNVVTALTIPGRSEHESTST